MKNFVKCSVLNKCSNNFIEDFVVQKYPLASEPTCTFKIHQNIKTNKKVFKVTNYGATHFSLAEIESTRRATIHVSSADNRSLDLPLLLKGRELIETERRFHDDFAEFIPDIARIRPSHRLSSAIIGRSMKNTDCVALIDYDFRNVMFTRLSFR